MSLPVAARSITSDQPDGFYLVGAQSVERSKVDRQAIVIEDAADFCRLQDRIGWHGPIDVDFSRYLVFAFSHDDSKVCSTDRDLASLDLGSDGLLAPRLVTPYMMCPASDRWEQDVLRVVAIARTAVPVWGFRYALANGVVRTFLLRHPRSRGRSAAARRVA